MSNASTPQLLDPGAWMHPSLAVPGMTVQLHFAVGSLAVLLWDIILHIPVDYTLLTEFRLNFSMLNVSMLIYLLQLLPMSLVWLLLKPFRLAIATIFLLFVMRVCALYRNQKLVVAFFSLSWISVLATSILLSIGTKGERVRNTKYRIEIKAPSSSRIAAIIPVVHDTLVFVATSWAFMGNADMEQNVQNGFDIMVLGKHLPAFSKSLLRNGQAYYLITLIISLVFMVAYLSRSVASAQSAAVPCSFGIPTFVLINNMTCYVYRNVRYGKYQDNDIRTSFIQRHLERAGQGPSGIELGSV